MPQKVGFQPVTEIKVVGVVGFIKGEYTHAGTWVNVFSRIISEFVIWVISAICVFKPKGKPMEKNLHKKLRCKVYESAYKKSLHLHGEERLTLELFNLNGNPKPS